MKKKIKSPSRRPTLQFSYAFWSLPQQPFFIEVVSRSCRSCVKSSICEARTKLGVYADLVRFITEFLNEYPHQRIVVSQPLRDLFGLPEELRLAAWKGIVEQHGD